MRTARKPSASWPTATADDTAQSTGDWLDIADLAERYKSSTRHIHRLAKLGLMPAGVKLGQLRRWSRTEITAWEAAGCKPVQNGPTTLKPHTGGA